MMKLPDPIELTRLLTARFGIAIEVVRGDSSEGIYFDIAPKDFHPNEGFLIRTTIGWRSIRSELLIGKFGAQILSEMADSTLDQRSIFAEMAHSLADSGGDVSFKINREIADPFEPESWVQSWTMVELNVRLAPLVLDYTDVSDARDAVLFWGGGVLGMVVSLLTVVEIEMDYDEVSEGVPEGAVIHVKVNRYERSRLNRALCLSIHGTRCKVCDVKFEERYGEMGRDFIHVHHIIPVSKIQPGYVINPSRDLIPVCPNCHAMLHTREPPFLVEELRARFLENNNKEF